MTTDGNNDITVVIDGQKIQNPRARVILDRAGRGVFLDGDLKRVIKWDRVKVYHPHGVTVGDKVVPWDMVHERKPDTVGNEDSRIGFSYNPYWSKVGKLLQETVKNVLEKTIIRIHDREIPRYAGKNCYVFDDPRIAFIHKTLMDAMKQHMDDNDSERKHALFGAVVDIICFMMKEDIFYRGRVFKSLLNLAVAFNEHPEMFALTAAEEYNYDRFRLENWLNNTVGHFPYEPYAEKERQRKLEQEQKEKAAAVA